MMDSIKAAIENEDEWLNTLKSLVKDDTELVHFEDILKDRFLLHFVRGRKYDSEKAFTTLKNYIQIRKVTYKSLFKNLIPSSTPAFNRGVIRVLKEKDYLQRIVCVVDFGLWIPSEVSIDDFCLGLIWIVEEAWNVRDVEENGFVSIFDTRKFNFQHFRMWSPSNITKAISIFESNIPIKFKQVNVIIEPKSLTRFAYKMIRPLLPAKIKERIDLFTLDSPQPFEFIPQDVLPFSLGGELTDDDAYDLDIVHRIKNKQDYYAEFVKTF